MAPFALAVDLRMPSGVQGFGSRIGRAVRRTFRFLWIGGHYRDLAMPRDEPEFERLAAWWRATSERPSVAATLVCKPRLISSYAHYSQGSATSDFAQSMQAKLGHKK